MLLRSLFFQRSRAALEEEFYAAKARLRRAKAAGDKRAMARYYQQALTARCKLTQLIRDTGISSVKLTPSNGGL